MKILFISHSYPPTIGGVESQNFNLSESLSNLTEVEIIANTRGKLFLPFFIVSTTFNAFFKMKKYNICLLGSGVIAPIGAFLKLFHPHKKFFCVVHGLDITYANRTGFLPMIYRFFNISALKKLHQLFMVGNATIKAAIEVGISPSLCTFIPNGVFEEKLVRNRTRKDLEKLLKMNLQNKKVIFRLGRFVPHKGTSWFLGNVVKKLPANYIFVAAGNRVAKNTAGDEDDFQTCEKIILEQHLGKKAFLLPSISQKNLLTLLNTVDLVVAPNIKSPGTMEGFGINVLEAAICKRVVIASNIEGLADAITDKENGFLIETANTTVWLKKITELLEKKDPIFMENFGKKAAAYVREHNTWEKIAKQYLIEMQKY